MSLHIRRLAVGAGPALVAALALAGPLVLAGLTPPIPATVDPSLPQRAIAAYRSAATRCPGLRWQLLAGIGHIESGHGTAHGSTLQRVTAEATPWIYGPSLDGRHGTQRIPIGPWLGWWGLTGPHEQAVGPMQFRAPTFTAHGTDGDGDGRLNPHDLDDAAATAATLLCATSSGHINDERTALAHYNHGHTYADAVIDYADNLQPTSTQAVGTGLCPVAGPTTFTDTWGAPRSRGRTHRGVDMFAAHGTPIVAPEAGIVEHFWNDIGGHSVRLWADSGTYYYGTHLSGYAHAGPVNPGTIIGYVGTTGNAAGTPPHLHFEIHPNRPPGAPANPTNPTPTVTEWCQPQRHGSLLNPGD